MKKLFVFILLFGLVIGLSSSTMAVSEEEKYGGTLVYGQGAPADALDPHMTTLGSSADITVNIFDNFYLGAHVQLKNMITTTDIPNYDNLYVPGFRRTFDNSSIGAGWGYSISYMIPIYSKIKTQAVDN